MMMPKLNDVNRIIGVLFLVVGAVFFFLPNLFSNTFLALSMEGITLMLFKVVSLGFMYIGVEEFYKLKYIPENVLFLVRAAALGVLGYLFFDGIQVGFLMSLNWTFVFVFWVLGVYFLLLFLGFGKDAEKQTT